MPYTKVIKAYETLISDIEAFAARLNGDRGAFIAAGEFETAKVLVNSDQQLRSFARQLSKLHDAFVRQTGSADQSMQGRAGRADALPSQGRAARTRLKVTFQGGQVIQEETAALTFALVIEALGIERVAGLGWRMNNEPLVSSRTSLNYEQEKIGSWYVMTHSNTNHKKRILDGLAMQLGVHLRVEVIH